MEDRAKHDTIRISRAVVIGVFVMLLAAFVVERSSENEDIRAGFQKQLVEVIHIDLLLALPDNSAHDIITLKRQQDVVLHNLCVDAETIDREVLNSAQRMFIQLNC